MNVFSISVLLLFGYYECKEKIIHGTHSRKCPCQHKPIRQHIQQINVSYCIISDNQWLNFISRYTHNDPKFVLYHHSTTITSKCSVSEL